MVKNLAIIPARSGSQRIRDKNIRPFAGRPLMAWMIEAALASGVFSRVFVSTDSERYAEIARQWGAWVPFLRDSLQDGHSGLAQLAHYELKRIESALGESFDSVSILQPTCPLFRSKDIANVYQAFVSGPAPSMMTCFPFCHGNPWWAVMLDEEGCPTGTLNLPECLRSQDRPQLYCPTGAAAFARTEQFRKDPLGTMTNRRYFKVSWEVGFDIDEPRDFEMGELLLKCRND